MTATLTVALVACGGAPTTSPDLSSTARLMRVDELAAGKLDALPTGTQFVRVLLFQQSPGETSSSRKHQPGVIYQEAGVQQLIYTDGRTFDIQAGTARYSESVAHSHVNVGQAGNVWYFIALWPSLQRGAPLASATSQIVFETEDIPSSALSPGSYIETLRRTSLQTGGRTAAHRFSGLEAIYVLEGSLTVNVAGGQPMHLNAGQGGYVAPGMVTQELAGGGSTVTYLAFFVSPQGQAFETDVSSAP